MGTGCVAVVAVVVVVLVVVDVGGERGREEEEEEVAVRLLLLPPRVPGIKGGRAALMILVLGERGRAAVIAVVAVE